MKILFLSAVMLGLSGCAMFAPQIEKAAGSVQDGVDRYCAEVDEASRAKFRAQVNPTPGGHTITVECAQ